MFTMKNNKLYFLLVVLSFALALPVKAQEKNDSIKEFLKDSEFGLQRKQTQASAIGKKGLLVTEDKKSDISDLVEVDLIDPFQNKTIKGTQTELEPLDDGIELDVDDIRFQEEIDNFRLNIEDYFTKIEKQDGINPVDLINKLTITRIVNSPIKYVEIFGKKYSEKDELKIRVNIFAKQDEFEQMLSDVNIRTRSAEEEELIEEVRLDALERFNALTENPDTALNIIKVVINEISSAQVSFLIDDKTYKVIMKR